jgi:1,4-alpha-glucan branching enzyme
MYLIDTLHEAGIGVILDWVPSFPDDAWIRILTDLIYFNILIAKGYHPDWKSLILIMGAMRYALLD